MAVDLCFLAVETVSNQGRNENTHFWPTKTGANKPPGSSHTWMMYVVERPNGGGLEAGGQKRFEYTSGNITQK
jgi:hypothetical protein